MGRWKTGRFLIASAVTATLIFSLLLVLLPVEPASAGSWPGANGKIALEVGMEPACEIYVVNPDGTGFRQLTDNDVCDHNPDWSSDGRKLAIERYDGNDDEIWVILADGRDDHQITDNSVDDYDPAWSPDGSRIAFERNRNIYVINPDGSGLNPVTSGGNDYNPEWLPELGSRIAFDRYDEQTDMTNIYTVKPDGTDEQQVTTGGNYGDPAWSPDGRKIAFERGGDVWVMNADGTGEKMIAQASDTIEEIDDPDWQPITWPVGGVVVPVNKLAVLAPYLALISLVGAVTVAVAVQRRRRP